MIGREIKTTLLIEAKLDPQTLKRVQSAGKDLQKALGVGKIAQEFQGVAKALKDIEKSLNAIKTKGLGQALSAATGGAVGGPGAAIGAATGARRAHGSAGAGAAPTAAGAAAGPVATTMQQHINAITGADRPGPSGGYAAWWSKVGGILPTGVPGSGVTMSTMQQAMAAGGLGPQRAGGPAANKTLLAQQLRHEEEAARAITGARVSTIKIGDLMSRSGIGPRTGRPMRARDTVFADMLRSEEAEARAPFAPDLFSAISASAWATERSRQKMLAAGGVPTSSGVIIGGRAGSGAYEAHQIAMRNRRAQAYLDSKQEQTAGLAYNRRFGMLAFAGAGVAAGTAMGTGAFSGAAGIGRTIGGLGAAGGMALGSAAGLAYGWKGGPKGALVSMLLGGAGGAALGGPVFGALGNMIQQGVMRGQEGLSFRQAAMGIGPLMGGGLRPEMFASFAGDRPDSFYGERGTAVNLGYSPQAAFQFAASSVAAGRSSFTPTMRSLQDQQFALEARRGFGLNANAAGGYIFGGGRGGYRQGRWGAGRTFGSARDAFDAIGRSWTNTGLSTAERNEVLSFFGQQGQYFAETGIGVSPDMMQQTSNRFGGGYRGFQFSRGLLDYGRQMSATGPQGAIDMFALQTLGGYGEGGDYSAGSLRSAYMRMEEGGTGPHRAKRLINGALNWGGGNTGLSLLFLNQTLRHVGIPFGHRLSGALAEGNLPRIESELQAEFDSLSEQANAMTDRQVRDEREVAARKTAQGLRMLKDFTEFERSSQALHESMERSSGWIRKITHMLNSWFPGGD